MTRNRKLRQEFKKAKKLQALAEQHERLEQNLDNAEKYLEKGENVEGLTWLHFGDWRGKSGHPNWMKNWMVPWTQKRLAKIERELENTKKRTKDKKLTKRKHGKNAQ